MPEQVALDFLGELRRTHNCGELRAADAGKRAVLMGWVHRRRDHGGVLFVNLRDREGVTQIVFRGDGDREVHGQGRTTFAGICHRGRRAGDVAHPGDHQSGVWKPAKWKWWPTSCGF